GKLWSWMPRTSFLIPRTRRASAMGPGMDLPADPKTRAATEVTVARARSAVRRGGVVVGEREVILREDAGQADFQKRAQTHEEADAQLRAEPAAPALREERRREEVGRGEDRQVGPLGSEHGDVPQRHLQREPRVHVAIGQRRELRNQGAIRAWQDFKAPAPV